MFRATKNDAYLEDWWNVSTAEKAPDIELEDYSSLIKLRNISNRLIKNNHDAATANQAYTSMIQGGNLRTKVLSKNNSRAEREANAVLKEKLPHLSKNGNLDLTGINEAIINSAFSDGDVLINLPMNRDSKQDLKTFVELIEARRIKTPPQQKENPRVRNGVVYSDKGETVGYYVKKAVFSSYYFEKEEDFNYVSAFRKTESGLVRRVARLFRSPFNSKPSVSRQYPVLTPVMDLMRYTEKYLESVLMGARVSACFSAAIETNNPAKTKKSISESSDITGGKKYSRLQPGLVMYLRKGEKISSIAPNKPSDNFDDFIERLSRYFSSVLRIPYEFMYLDLSNVNYSSWRGGSTEVQRNRARWIRELQIIDNWIVSTLILEAIAREYVHGSLNVMSVHNKFPQYQSLDPEKSARSNRLELQNGTISKQIACADNNKDYKEVMEDTKEEQEEEIQLKAEGLKLKKEFEQKWGIVFPDESQADRDTSDSRREGEQEGDDLTDEEKRERRKQDGNW